jgi:hypothetical protein
VNWATLREIPLEVFLDVRNFVRPCHCQGDKIPAQLNRQILPRQQVFIFQAKMS